MFFSSLLAAAVLTNLTDVSIAIHASRIGETFAIDGTVLLAGQSSNTLFIIASQNQCMTFRDVTPERLSTRLSTGNAILASGVVAINENGSPAPNCDNLTVSQCGATLRPVDVTVRDLKSGGFDNHLVRVRGTVMRTFRDEIDPKYVYLVLASGGIAIHVTCCDDRTSSDDMRSLRGAEVSVTGAYFSIPSGLRELFGKTVNTLSPDAIEVLRPAPQDPFSAPMIDTSTPTSPDEVAALGRRRTIGRVIAVRQKNEILIRDAAGKVRKLTLEKFGPPAYGESIEAVGMPETDLYRINLADVQWRPFDVETPAEAPPERMSAEALLTDGRGNYKINPMLHGRAVQIEGSIVNLPNNDPSYGIMTLKSGDFTIPVDISANRGVTEDLSVGCSVSVAGTCVVETESWRPFSPLPRATGITVIVRTPADIVVLSRPSWWTPQKLMIIMGILLVAILAIVIWNRALQRIIVSKSRQLLKGEVTQMRTVLRIDERTRLAVELHDSLSQNLSGVACQIAATKGSLPGDAEDAAQKLATAERMLLSCRTELRRCLWDLRGDALEEADFAEAIRKTLAPVAIGVETQVRFNVPRARISDTTAHSVICIVRELVANAIRHGHAKTIRVAGELHDGTLSFSVRDDGCGFDPAKCDGPAEGHFGLEGIRERVRRLGGEFAISSSQSGGTRAEVMIDSIQPAAEGMETT